MKLVFLRLSVLWIFLFACVGRTSAVCNLNSTNSGNTTGSCNFDNGSKCGYTFNGYWKAYTGSYSYIGISIPGSRGKAGDAYALYDLEDTRSNNDKTMVSPSISGGHYCLSFWFYKSSSSSILNVLLMSSMSTILLWNATGSVSKQWTHTTIEVQSSDSFQIIFKADKPGFFDFNTVALDDIVISLFQDHISSAVSTVDMTESLLPTPSAESFSSFWMDIATSSIISMNLFSTEQRTTLDATAGYVSTSSEQIIKPTSALYSLSSVSPSFVSIHTSHMSIIPSYASIISVSLDQFSTSGTVKHSIQPTRSLGPDVTDFIEFSESPTRITLQPSTSINSNIFHSNTFVGTAVTYIGTIPSASFFNLISVSGSLDETLHITPTPTLSFQTLKMESPFGISGTPSQERAQSVLTSYRPSPSIPVLTTLRSVDLMIHNVFTIAPPAFITYDVFTEYLQPSTISETSTPSKVSSIVRPVSSSIFNAAKFAMSPTSSFQPSSMVSDLPDKSLISSEVPAANSASKSSCESCISVSPSVMSNDLLSESRIVSLDISTTYISASSSIERALVNTAPLSIMSQTHTVMTMSSDFSTDMISNNPTSDVLVASSTSIDIIPSTSIPQHSSHQLQSQSVLSSGFNLDSISYSLTDSTATTIMYQIGAFSVEVVPTISLTTDSHATIASSNAAFISYSVVEASFTTSELSAMQTAQSPVNAVTSSNPSFIASEISLAPTSWSSANTVTSRTVSMPSETSSIPKSYSSANVVTSTPKVSTASSILLSTTLSPMSSANLVTSSRPAATSSIVTATTSAMTTTPTTPFNQQLLYSALHISCGGNKWNIRIDLTVIRQMYSGSSSTSIYLGNMDCKGTVENNTLVFQQPLRNCSSTEKKTNISINFRNKLAYAEHDPNYSFIIRRRLWEVNVECDVPRTAVAHTHLHHGTTHLPDVIMTPSPEQSILTLQFYKDSAYLHAISGPILHVSLGDLVYVKAFTSTLDSSVKLVLQSCYVQPQAGPRSTMQYYLIKDRCVTDRNTHIISYSQHEVRFEFQEVEFSADPTGLDIYCQAKLCDLLDFTARCSPSCGHEHIIG